MEKIYRHYKGGLYKYICDANLEWCPNDPNSHVIVYEGLDTGLRWVRPRNEFFGWVFTNNKMIRRFELEEGEDFLRICSKCGSKLVKNLVNCPYC